MMYRKVIVGMVSMLAIAGCKAETIDITSRDDQPTVTAKESRNSRLPKNLNCQSVSTAFSNLPSEVLIGTDVSALESFASGKFSAGTYHAENGGAELRLTIRETEEGLTAQRNYIEPGLASKTKIYTNLCLEDEFLYGDFVHVKFVKDGLLWLELKPDNDFIPTDLWFYLEKTN